MRRRLAERVVRAGSLWNADGVRFPADVAVAADGFRRDRSREAGSAAPASRSVSDGTGRPSNGPGARIAGFWREVLPIPQVGIHDNFFELGGNSLLATQIASRIQDAFKVHLSLRMVLEQPTVAKLALAVQRHLEEEDTKAQMPLRS